MGTNGHFSGRAKSCLSEKLLKKKCIKYVRMPESYKNNEQINFCIDFCATFFALYFSPLKVMKEKEDKKSGK
jgi:hypothetical protein